MKIELINISKKFQKNEILHDVNISLTSGKIYGFIGRNGSGKSVLLKIICGLYEPSNGKVLFDGVDLFESGKIPPNTRALIEKPSFIGELTGRENLEMLAAIQNKIGKDEIDKVIDMVNLGSDSEKQFGKYSLGMKQKLGIAQALMEDPEVIILDEPFNGIEEETTNKLRKLLISEKKKGKLIILASHITDDINLLADEVYQFDNGFVKKYKK